MLIIFNFFSLSSSFSPYIPISSTILSSSQWKAQHNEITCWGATMRRQWLLKCWFCPSKHISNGFYVRTWMVITVTVLYSHGLGALGFPIESNPLCTNLFRKWFLGRYTNSINPLSFTPARFPKRSEPSQDLYVFILSYLLQIRYMYTFICFFLIKADLHLQPGQMSANRHENLFKFKSRSLVPFHLHLKHSILTI